MSGSLLVHVPFPEARELGELTFCWGTEGAVLFLVSNLSNQVENFICLQFVIVKESRSV
jgi:hypothetical protein